MSSLFFNKKADIQMSLSWIFMIIVGSFFLLVAYNIIAKYSENEDTKYYLQVKSILSNILLNSGQTIGYEENYIKPIDTFFKNSKVEIICNDGLPILSINDNPDENSDFLKNIPSFMTEIEEGDISFTYLAVENFKMPYKTTNMMAIVSKKNLIVFDEDSKITEVLREKFEESAYRDALSFMEADFTSLSSDYYNELQDKKDYQTVMFVSDDDVSIEINFFNELKNIKGYHLRVSGESVDYKYGTLSYFDKNGDAESFEYVDYRDGFFDSKPINMITMAIFSNPETFSCGYELILKLSLDVTDYYINKASYLEEISSDTTVCSQDLISYLPSGKVSGDQQVSKYRDLKEVLEDLRNELKEHKFNNPEIMYNYIEEVQQLSEDLSDNSCEMIY